MFKKQILSSEKCRYLLPMKSFLAYFSRCCARLVQLVGDISLSWAFLTDSSQSSLIGFKIRVTGFFYYRPQCPLPLQISFRVLSQTTKRSTFCALFWICMRRLHDEFVQGGYLRNFSRRLYEEDVWGILFLSGLFEEFV